MSAGSIVRLRRKLSAVYTRPCDTVWQADSPRAGGQESDRRWTAPAARSYVRVIPMPCVICLGDSITAGALDDVGGGWVNRLKREYMDRFVAGRGGDVSVFNCGMGGETTVGLSARFAAEVGSRLVPDDRNIVLLAYGMNDLAARPDRERVAVSDYRERLSRAIAWTRARGARAALINITPIAEALDGVPTASGSVRSRAAITDYNRALAALAADEGVALIDAHAALQPDPAPLLTADGVHPNARGHEAIRRAVQPIVDRLLAD